MIIIYIEKYSVTTQCIKLSTRGPVNVHLTPNPGIYFNVFLYMYIAAGQGHTTPWGQMLMSTGSPYHFAHLLQVLKQSL